MQFNAINGIAVSYDTCKKSSIAFNHFNQLGMRMEIILFAQYF